LRPFPLEVHIHKGMDFGIAFSSGLMQYYGDLLLTPEPGEVWLGAAWEPHAWRTVPEGARFLIVTFLPEVLEEGLGSEISLLGMFALPPGERPRATSAALRAQMITIGEEIVRESEEKRDGWEIAVRIGLVRALFALCREWRPVKAARVHVKWRWDASDSPAGLPVSPGHSTIWDPWAAPPGALPLCGA